MEFNRVIKMSTKWTQFNFNQKVKKNIAIFMNSKQNYKRTKIAQCYEKSISIALQYLFQETLHIFHLIYFYTIWYINSIFKYNSSSIWIVLKTAGFKTLIVFYVLRR